MSDTPDTNTDTTEEAPPNPLQGVLTGAFSGFINSLNPLAGLGALISGGTIGDAISNPDETKKTVKTAITDLKTNVGLVMINSSLIVLGVVCIAFAVIVALGQDKLSSVTGSISNALKSDE